MAVVVEEGRSCDAHKPASCEPQTPRVRLDAAAERPRSLGVGAVLGRLATPWLRRTARQAFRALLRGIRRYVPRLYNWFAAWIYEFYYSYRYAKEYQQRPFAYQPLISIVIPVHNPPLQYLVKAIDSIKRQKYARWELCIADDASTDPGVRSYLERLVAREPRAKVVFLEKNQHISLATNQAMRMATGDYFLFIDNDDTLFTPWALNAFVDALQDDRPDLLYADNVMIDESDAVQSFSPKPDWEVEFLASTYFVTHPLMIGRRLMERLGGFRPECSGVQDLDLVNRASALGPEVKHIPKYLYGWRMLPGSVTTSTDAKPNIIPRSLQSHNDLLRDRSECRDGKNGSVSFDAPLAVSTWPAFFKKRRIGAFKLQFGNLQPLVDSLAVVVVGGDRGADFDQIEPLLRTIRYPLSDVLMLTRNRPAPASQRPSENTPRLVPSSDLVEALAETRSDYVLFLDASIDMTYATAVDELLGYLVLHPRVGVVAGKVLDHDHWIRCSSYVFLDDLHMFGVGHHDGDYDGYWYKNRLAHNALAVPGRFFMTRTRLVAEYGLRYEEYHDYAVPDFCLRLRNDAFRTVYNPWAISLCPELPASQTTGRGYTAFKERYADLFGKDPHYPWNL